MKENIYITGHKNPDSDSICAALAYAEYKNANGDTNAVPVKLGEINRETRFILDYFGVESPTLLETVRLSVEDLDFDKIAPVSPDISLRMALELMKRNNLNSLPIIDEDEQLVGIVTISDSKSINYTPKTIELSEIGSSPSISRLMVVCTTDEVNLDIGNVLNSNLTHVKIQNANILENADWNKMINAEMIYLYARDFGDLSSISGSSITQLGLVNAGEPLNYNPFDQITKLGNLVAIEAVNLGISQLSNLENYDRLQYAYLSGNSINDASGLANLNNLLYLDVSKNPISDISWAKEDSALKTIVALDTKIPVDTKITGKDIYLE